MDRRGDAVDLPIIRQSFRCFWFGLVGVIPLAGSVVGWQALRLFANIERASGESPRRDFPILLLAITIAALPFVQLTVSIWVFVSFLLGVFFAYGIWVFAEYATGAPKFWNPARAWAWGGAVLAHSGFALSLLILETFYVAVYKEMILGAK